jgi:tRNA threonylcarbamoyladenosine biosynthesis protein TsaB
MRLLALETSSEIGSVALASGAQVIERTIPTPREQTQLVLPHIDALLADAGVRLRDLDGITFGRGPGSFTGLRVAAAVAQGLAVAADLALLPVSSLAALAQCGWRCAGLERTLVGVDAHMGEMYWAAFNVRDGVAELADAERLSAPRDVRPFHGEPWAAIGNAFARYRDVLAGVLAGALVCEPELVPAARDLLPFARRDLAAGRAVTAAEALPVYLRDESAWRRSGSSPT